MKWAQPRVHSQDYSNPNHGLIRFSIRFVGWPGDPFLNPFVLCQNRVLQNDLVPSRFTGQTQKFDAAISCISSEVHIDKDKNTSSWPHFRYFPVLEVWPTRCVDANFYDVDAYCMYVCAVARALVNVVGAETELSVTHILMLPEAVAVGRSVFT